MLQDSFTVWEKVANREFGAAMGALNGEQCKKRGRTYGLPLTRPRSSFPDVKFLPASHTRALAVIAHANKVNGLEIRLFFFVTGLQMSVHQLGRS
jgi:hypothetical protein